MWQLVTLLLAVRGLDNSIWNHWLCKAADWTCSVSEGCMASPCTVIVHVYKCSGVPLTHACIGCVWLLWGLTVPHIVSGSSKCMAGTNVGPYFCGGWLLAQRAVRELASSQLSDPWWLAPLLAVWGGLITPSFHR